MHSYIIAFKDKDSLLRRIQDMVTNLELIEVKNHVINYNLIITK